VSAEEIAELLEAIAMALTALAALLRVIFKA
jgi:hypothetical protein